MLQIIDDSWLGTRGLSYKGCLNMIISVLRLRSFSQRWWYSGSVYSVLEHGKQHVSLLCGHGFTSLQPDLVEECQRNGVDAWFLGGPMSQTMMTISPLFRANLDIYIKRLSLFFLIIGCTTLRIWPLPLHFQSKCSMKEPYSMTHHSSFWSTEGMDIPWTKSSCGSIPPWRRCPRSPGIPIALLVQLHTRSKVLRELARVFVLRVALNHCSVSNFFHRMLALMLQGQETYAKIRQDAVDFL